jgi:hypothetical protein
MTPNPVGSTGSGLANVSCSSSGSCTAVGSYSDVSAVAATLAERDP